jgi:hypothetical protein
VVVNMLPPPGYPPPGYGYYPPPPGYPPQPGAPPPHPPHAPRTADELAAALEKLNELRIAGLLTDEEFQAQKQKLLASM